MQYKSKQLLIMVKVLNGYYQPRVRTKIGVSNYWNMDAVTHEVVKKPTMREPQLKK